MEKSNEVSKKRHEPEKTKMESSEILNIAKEISSYNGRKRDKERIFRKKYHIFAESYPVLFEMSTQDNFDIKYLEYMLHLRNQIDNTNLSQHDASAKVGQMLYDGYVKDKIKDAPSDK